MSQLRIDVRHFDRPSLPQEGWRYFATERAAALRAGEFRPGLDQLLHSFRPMSRRPTVFEFLDQPAPAWMTTAAGRESRTGERWAASVRRRQRRSP